MNSTTAEKELATRANLFKALGHPVRLLILNLILEKSRHGEELAAILNLKPATISHHLTQLSEAGLLAATKEQYYQVYSLVGEVLQRPLTDLVRLSQPGLTTRVEGDAYQQKVLQTFLRHGRLVQIPAQQKKRQVILERLVQEFEPGRRYTEQEVNHILLDFHEDVAALRRYMIETKLMTRDHGIYWRTETPPQP
jgi:ArsR family transcriptional regulator, arsenate/arsenite/antimonite-responsive transcriptional repressor